MEQAAELLGVSAGTVRRWADSGRLACRRTLGGQRRFRRDDLVHHLAAAGRHAAGVQRRDGAEERYQLLLETSLELASTLHLDEVLQSAARRLSLTLETPDCDIYRLVGDDRLFCVAASANGVLR